MINHLKYDPATQGEMGTRYFKGVYEPNNPMHVKENELSKDEPQNYYSYLAKIREN
jgi:hypothetical protein